MRVTEEGSSMLIIGQHRPNVLFWRPWSLIWDKHGQIMEIIAVALRLACEPYIPKDSVFLYCCLRSFLDLPVLTGQVPQGCRVHACTSNTKNLCFSDRHYYIKERIKINPMAKCMYINGERNIHMLILIPRT